ncbi:MAG: hypothetical protein ACRBBP_03260 [Bdellovibrionales bacterium]
MEKIFIFFLILTSSRHLQSTLNWGPQVYVSRNRVRLKELGRSLDNPLKLNSQIYVYKSIYSAKRSGLRRKDLITLVFTTSKKKKPPLRKDGLQIFIPANKWGMFYFIR